MSTLLSHLGRPALWVSFAACFLFLTISDAEAQQQGEGQIAGVSIDAEGVLRHQVYPDPTGMLTRERMAAARATLPPEVARASKLRKISLTRLEKAIIANGGVPTDEMKYLAGLLRVRYVFFYPETKDIVIAGPAEGWRFDLAGRAVGLTSGRPVILLEHLVVALRAFPPGGEPTELITCSIDPTPEGLANAQQFLKTLGRFIPAGTEAAVAQYMAENLRTAVGLQKVTIRGVPADTHFAHILVEADYRMKMIGIGLEPPPVRMVTFIDKASPSTVSRELLVRWWFVPDYQCVRRSEDGLAIELVGSGVKLVGEDELVSMEGDRQATGRANPASQAFTTSFTKMYPAIAERSPVFAQLRNLIDLCVAAAYIQKEDFYGKAEWKMEFFGDESKFAVRTYPAPKAAPTAVNALVKRSQVMTPFGGGVEIEAQKALLPENLLADPKGEVNKVREEIRAQLSTDHWWWD
ncbi:MAG: DUF1598 domain-containing protein [Thermoguttaceae bacterium]|nr:DUF1598 domain-containing protein [Thermoguttaceae bacterium]MDW8077998.1 DUF1598 domain-containing protein [Thermoguttaceae bacterium]